MTTATEYKLFNENSLTQEHGRFLKEFGGRNLKSSAEQGQMLKLFDNTRHVMKSEGTSSGDVAQYDTVLLNLLRRTIPNLVGTKLIGQQVMKTPNAVIFAQRVLYGDNPSTGTETWNANRPDVNQSGTGGGAGMATSIAETLGTAVVDPTAVTATTPIIELPAWGKMSMKIDKISVEAKTRALKANFTNELVEDFRALFGGDAYSELAQILQGEIMAEIDYEILAFISSQAKVGTAINVATATDGRWAAEKYLGLVRLLDRNGNIIGQETRRGRATWIVTTPDVAAALEMTGKIHNDYEYYGGDQPEVNVTGLTYVGKLARKYDLYIDPYAVSGTDWAILGYKGSDMDAGAYYCPYVPMTMYTGQGEDTFNPKIGFKTRYGLVHNPYASGVAAANPYFRKIAITNL